MKDLALRDIFPRQDALPSRLVVLQQGHWLFTNSNWATGVTQPDGATYFYMQTNFGTVLTNQPNPRKLHKRGFPGDYLVFNPAGYYDIIGDGEYKLRFPRAYSTTSNGTPMTSNTGASTTNSNSY